jgi:hypothetical protein
VMVSLDQSSERPVLRAHPSPDAPGRALEVEDLPSSFEIAVTDDGAHAVLTGEHELLVVRLADGEVIARRRGELFEAPLVDGNSLLATRLCAEGESCRTRLERLAVPSLEARGGAQELDVLGHAIAVDGDVAAVRADGCLHPVLLAAAHAQ